MQPKAGHDRKQPDAIKTFDLWDGRQGEVVLNGLRVKWQAVKYRGRMQIRFDLPPGTGARSLAKQLKKS